MALGSHSDPLNVLINEFQKMPGIGPKTAQRLAFYVLGLSQTEIVSLTEAIQIAKAKIKYCSVCHNITVTDPCELCAGSNRDKTTVCVVSEPRDLIALEKTREYKGLYHVLGGLISPLDGITPESLRIKELLERLKNDVIKEIILAINPTVEGEATSIYLSKLIKPLGIKITRIAYGLPIGSDIDYADELTLTKAYQGRTEL